MSTLPYAGSTKSEKHRLELRLLRAEVEAGLEALDRSEFADVAGESLNEYLEGLLITPAKSAKRPR